MVYDRIVIGGGAAGLCFAALSPAGSGLILEKGPSPGQKLLLSGSGQCNLSHGGSIKDFIGHYGPGGSKIRSALYKASNLSLMKFFTDRGLALVEREDGKIFPKSMDAAQVLDLLLRQARENGWSLRTNCPVMSLAAEKDGTFLINGHLRAKQVIVASGGCSYPATGSDGSMLPLLQGLGLSIIKPKPALVPVTVQQYPYSDLAGISFAEAIVRIDDHSLTGGLLFTHNSFSGPAVLNLSRYVRPGGRLKISYLPRADLPDASGDRRKAGTFIADSFQIPKRFAEVLLFRAGADPAARAASLPISQLRRVTALLREDLFSISGTSGFGSAMATSGGVSLTEVDTKTFESKQYPGLFLIGEVLDIDGDTGGYNLQFAFSSGYGAAMCVL